MKLKYKENTDFYKQFKDTEQRIWRDIIFNIYFSRSTFVRKFTPVAC